MKIKYKYQSFQVEAAHNVVRAFQGQPFKDGVDYIMDRGKQQTNQMFDTLGFGNNPLQIDRQALADNVRKMQMEQGLKPIEHLEGDGINLTIEMETGTGKTYTYIKTMFELNKHYGWSKFIIVVPSIAIREGVYKSFQSMEDHFAHDYGKRIQFFIYNSAQLSKIDSFASDNNLHVMIINTQAFSSSINKDKNKAGSGGNAAARIIFSKRDEFGGRRPIDVLAKTHPVMIIDEPQSVLGANANNSTRQGIKLFNPLALLRYSATHREVLNMVFRLDALDAYNRQLVKKIEVKGVRQVGSTATNGFLYLDEIVISKNKNPQARITFDVRRADGNTKQTTRLVDEGFDFFAYSDKLTEYQNNYVVESIDGREGKVTLLNGMELYEGDTLGEVTEEVKRRIQIRETIKTHLERERQLFPRGIKVLSLFFIDHVENYRTYGEEGSGKGQYAKIFEEEYLNMVREMQPTFNDASYTRYLSRFAPEQVHNGYFSKDKKGHFINSSTKRKTTESDDESAYDLIMKNKERLLSFDEPTRFIFSHSALKEGWDNPNVFQICTLKDSANETNKRQEVGRGMRLCVNKEGERQDVDVLGDTVFDTNVLTIVASESYESFSKQLQKEIADAVEDRPIVITPNLFTDKVYEKTNGEKWKISVNDANEIYFQLRTQNYVNRNNELTDTYYDAKRTGTLNFGEEFETIKEGIIRTLDSIYNPKAIAIDNGRNTRDAKFQTDKFYKKEFQELWKRINIRSYYKVDFESSELIKKAIKAIDKNLNVTEIHIVIEQGHMNSIRDKESLETATAMEQTMSKSYHVRETVGRGVTYDLIGQIVDKTGLTRKTIVQILKGIKPATFLQFKMNPEEFIQKVAIIINDAKAESVIEKISYERTTDTYDVNIFTENTLRGKLGGNAIESTKSLYDLVVVDSLGVEKNFAEELEKAPEVEVYTKLPRDFYINTPIGKYIPDWAIVFKEGEVKHIYFVAETKGDDLREKNLRETENAKIECAIKHFKAISPNGSVRYGVVKNYEALKSIVNRD